MPNYYSEKQYEGPEAMVVAMDIGTTQSAVSFAYFSPGSQPQGEMVALWPGQAGSNGTAKIPSMVSYRKGVATACGAEAMREFEEHPENVAYWFKLHLHPTVTDPSKNENPHIPPLPAGVTIERVYADMMRYLMENTKKFFVANTVDGEATWARLRGDIVILLATPNGWDIREQSTLRKAAIRASLVTETNASQLLQFVTEASVHYVLARQPSEWLQKATVFAVIDCGGSTVDTTVYRCVSPSPLSIEETCPSECVQTGGIFVNGRVKELLETKLEGSAFGDPVIIKSITDAFEKELKPRFNGVLNQYDLNFGTNRDNAPSLGINNGSITLSNQELKPLFDAVINEIATNCSSIIASQKPEYVIMVGGFAKSPYLRSVLSRRLAPYNVQMVRVGDHATKAAACVTHLAKPGNENSSQSDFFWEGVIIGHITQFVTTRLAKATFGGCVRQLYDRNKHREREHTVQLYADGEERVDGAFHVWIKKGAVLKGTFAHKLSYHVAWDATSTPKSELSLNLETVGIEVFAWESDNDPPIWCKDEQGVVLEGMRLICTLKADLSQLAGGLHIKTGHHGKRFYRVNYDVCVYFGGTQLRAKLQWKEKGVLREGPVAVMP